METMNTDTAPPVALDRLVRLLKSKAAREWRAIWKRYPHHKRTDEERQIVHDEQIRINGYTQALDDILANHKTMETMTDTPETDGIVEQCYRQINVPTNPIPADFARKLERERDELRAKLREEQQLHVQTLNERDEARQWESQALVARIQRDEFSKTLGEVREILCNAMPNENAPTSFMAATLVKERDEAQKQLLNLWKP